jgi:PIN domain nuclease of toxin-antitoxin system
MLNLDTHILIHALAGSLKPRERALLSREPWSVSAIVLWEVATLAQRKLISVDLDSAAWNRAIARVRIWPLDLAVAHAIAKLDFESDPADEIIAATSVVHRIPLVTRDRRIQRSKLVPLAK